MKEKDLIKALKGLRSCRPDPVWQERARVELLAYFQEKYPARREARSFYFSVFAKPALVTLVLLFVFYLTGFILVSAAKGSLPGEPLYPVKRLSEKVKISLTFNKQEKTVLRAEILSARISEAKILAEKINKEDDQQKVAPKLVAAAREIHREIKILKKEIASQVAPAPIDVTLDEGSLPIRDGREVAKVLQSSDLQKTLEQTKALLREKDLVTALAKTDEAEKHLTETKPIDSSIANAESTGSGEERPTTPLDEQKSPLEQQKQDSPVGSASSAPVKQNLKPEPISPDFKIELEREEPMKINPIRE